jgi:hypothetical protein
LGEKLGFAGAGADPTASVSAMSGAGSWREEGDDRRAPPVGVSARWLGTDSGVGLAGPGPASWPRLVSPPTAFSKKKSVFLFLFLFYLNIWISNLL